MVPKKKQPPQIERKLMEEFEKIRKQGAGIKELLKQLLDEAASNRVSMAQMEESMRELKTVAYGSLKRIEAMERRVEAPPPPPLPPPQAVGSYPHRTRRRSRGSLPW
jgi:hypothetical protein